MRRPGVRILIAVIAAGMLTAALAWSQSARPAAEPGPSPKDLLRELRGGDAAPSQPRRRPPATQPAATATATAPTAPAATQPARREPRSVLARLAHAGGKLWLYFGPIGVASVAGWLLVWIVLAAWAARTRGMGVSLGVGLLAGLGVGWLYTLPQVGGVVGLLIWLAVFAALGVVLLSAAIRREVPAAFAALLLALAAFGLALWNSDAVSEIREDRSEEIAAARLRQEQAQKDQAKNARGLADDVHFADGDANDTDGKRPADANGPAEPKTRPAYDYRRGGRKRRDANMLGDANAEVLTKVVAEQARADAPARAVRTLPGPDLIVANQLDTLNRFAARLTLVVALILAGTEYLRRFNQTFGSLLPLPIACQAIDSLWPKTYAVHLHDPDGRALREYIETVVHKGESFLLFVPDDPWPGAAALPRLPLGGPWPLRKIACEPGDPAYSTPLIFESAWYGRYGFVLRTRQWTPAVAALLDGVLEALQLRRHTRAAAGRTLHLVWAVPAPLPTDVLAELVFLAGETNVKLLVAADAPPSPADAPLFEELCSA